MALGVKRRSTRSQAVLYKDYSSSDEDEDYSSDIEPKKRRKQKSHTTKNGNKSGNKSSNKSGNKGNKSDSNNDKQDAEEEINFLFQSLSQPDIDVAEVSLEWLESFEQHPHESMTVLINFILKCCGSQNLFETHDLLNLESANDTISELVILFEKQQNHKYPFKTLLPFKTNVLQFFETLVDQCHENGLLYKYNENFQIDFNQNKQNDLNKSNRQSPDFDIDSSANNFESGLSSPLMTQLITWVGCLSSCSIRPLRFISTNVLLTILVRLSNKMKIITTNLNKCLKQLKSTSSKSKSKLNSLKSIVQSYQSQKSTLIEYFDEITNIVIGHRYRDIDPIIRQDCIKYISQAMVIYPDYFLNAKFLRYFGWLLSDPNNQVRLEVTKNLLKFYKSSNFNSIQVGLKQFTQRYKPQLIKMIKIDSDNTIKLNLANIYCELLKIGFLDDIDNQEIMINFYQTLTESIENKPNNIIQKIRLELAKFVNTLNLNDTKSLLEKYSIFLENYTSDQVTYYSNDDIEDATDNSRSKLNLNKCFKYKSLIKILKESFNEDNNQNTGDINEIEEKNIMGLVFKNLYQLSTYENDWEFMIRYLLFDFSSVEFKSIDSNSSNDNVEIENIKQELELNHIDKLYLLDFIYGSFLLMFMSPNIKVKDTISTIILSKLVTYLPNLQSLLIKSNDLLNSFLQLWHLLLTPTDIKINIYNSFDNLNQKVDYNMINRNLLKYFQNYQPIGQENDQLMTNYEKYLNLILNNYNTNPNNTINLVTPEIRNDCQNLTQNLSDILADQLRLQVHNHNLDENAKTQNLIIDKLISVKDVSKKLCLLGEQIDINPFMNSNNSTITELIIVEILTPLNFENIQDLAKEFVCLVDQFNISLMVILNLVLISTSWKLEKLISYDESNQNLYDIEAILHDDKLIVIQLIRLLSKLNIVTEKIDQTKGSTVSIITPGVNLNKLKIKLSDCKTLIAAKIIDLVTSIKIFYIKFNQSNMFKNFSQFFDPDDEFGNLIVAKLPKELQEQLLDIFLTKEAALAKSLQIDLDRLDNENVNYQDADDEESDIEELNGAQSSPNLDDDTTKPISDNQKNLWFLEKNLCVYALKLFSLIKTSMVDKFIYQRIQLNSKKFEGIYQSLVDEQIKSINDLKASETELTN